MRKLFLLLFVLGSFSLVYGAKTKISVDVVNKSKTDKQYQRAPMRLPIDVFYDTDANTVEIYCGNDLEGEVYVYDINDQLIDYSSTLNTVLSLSNSPIHNIFMEGETWTATAVVE